MDVIVIKHIIILVLYMNVLDTRIKQWKATNYAGKYDLALKGISRLG